MSGSEFQAASGCVYQQKAEHEDRRAMGHIQTTGGPFAKPLQSLSFQPGTVVFSRPTLTSGADSCPSGVREGEKLQT